MTRASQGRTAITYVGYLIAFFLTVLGLVLNCVTFATNDYTWILIHALGASVLSSVLLALCWLRMPGPGRVVSACLLVANVWIILDAGLRRLPACLGWA